MTRCRTIRPPPIMMKSSASTAIAEIGPPFDGSPWLDDAGAGRPLDVVVVPLTVTTAVAVGFGDGVGEAMGVADGVADGLAEGLAEGVALGDPEGEDWRGSCARAAEAPKTTATKTPPAKRTPNARVMASRTSRVSSQRALRRQTDPASGS
jgi:hypothetical protein